jgi:hypothetical protein
LNPEGFDFCSLVETHLKHKLYLKVGKTFQTKFDASAGCWQNIKSFDVWKIKLVERNIIWKIGYFEKIPIQMVTAYLPSHNKSEGDETFRQL